MEVPRLLQETAGGSGPEPVWSSSGTGTFGRVFLVREQKSRAFYALKQMKIADVIRLKQEQHVHNEKEVLSEVNHPFLIRL